MWRINGSKFGAIKKEYNGRVYHSTKEANYAQGLDLRIKAGEVKSWSAQLRIPIKVNGQLITTYVPDFEVVMADGSVQIHEVKSKGTITPAYTIKKKLLHATYLLEHPEVQFIEVF